MKHKQQYVAPAILRQTALLPGVTLLSQSVVDNANVVSMGQDVENLDFSPDNSGGFNFNWEDQQ
jgi:hypothetical protein